MQRSGRRLLRRLRGLAKPAAACAVLILLAGATAGAAALLSPRSEATPPPAEAPAAVQSRWPPGTYRTDVILVAFKRPVTPTDIEQFSLTYSLSEDALQPPGDGYHRFWITDHYDPQDKVALVMTYPLVLWARVEPLAPK
jgi:hypothetical protein